MLSFNFAAVVLTLLVSDPLAETQVKIMDINNRQAPVIQPIPDFENKVIATYSSDKNRNPFYGKSLHREMSLHKPVKVIVDLNRTKQELEQFPVSELVMTGVLKKAKSFDAMIKTPTGHVVVASIGDYVGENHGRIKSIKPEGIEIAEAIDDGHGGYVQRVKNLALMENQKAEGF